MVKRLLIWALRAQSAGLALRVSPMMCCECHVNVPLVWSQSPALYASGQRI